MNKFSIFTNSYMYHVHVVFVCLKEGKHLKRLQKYLGATGLPF